MRLQNLPKVIELVSGQLIQAVCFVNHHPQPPYLTLIGNQSYQNRPFIQNSGQPYKAFRIVLISKTEKNKKQIFKFLINKKTNKIPIVSTQFIHQQKGLCLLFPCRPLELDNDLRTGHQGMSEGFCLSSCADVSIRSLNYSLGSDVYQKQAIPGTDLLTCWATISYYDSS